MLDEKAGTEGKKGVIMVSRILVEEVFVVLKMLRF